MSWQHFVPVQHSSLASFFLLLPFIFLSLPSANLKGNCLVFSTISQSVYSALVPVKTISLTLSCSASLPTHCYYPQSLYFLPYATWKVKYPSRGTQLPKIRSLFKIRMWKQRSKDPWGRSEFPRHRPCLPPRQSQHSEHVGTHGKERSWHCSGYWRSSLPTHTSHTQPGETISMGIKLFLEKQLLIVPSPSLPPHQPSCSWQSLLEAPKSFLFHVAGFADPALLNITQFVISLLTITLILTSCSKPLRYQMNTTKSPLIPITAANAESKMLKQSLIAMTWEFCLPRASKRNCR